MKRAVLVCIFLLSLSNLYSQNARRKGSIVLKNGLKQTGYILYKNWNTNPTEIEFSESEKGNYSKYDKNSISGFKIADDDILESYTLFTVNIDTSNQELANISTSIEGEGRTQEIFLKHLVEGKVFLYEAAMDYSRSQYFIAFGPTETPVELLNKRYQFKNIIFTYDAFREILKVKLTGCDAVSKILPRLKYTEPEITNLITSYNQCFGESTGVSKDFSSKPIFGGYISAGTSKLTVTSANNAFLYDFDQSISYAVGVSLNLFFKRTNKKVMFTSGVDIRKEAFEAKKETSNSLYEKVNVQLTYLELELGVRKYFFLNSVKPFVGLSLNNGFSLSTENKKTQTSGSGSSLKTTESDYLQVPAAKNADGSAIRKYQQTVKLYSGVNINKLYPNIFYMLGNGFSDVVGIQTSISTVGAGLSYHF